MKLARPVKYLLVAAGSILLLAASLIIYLYRFYPREKLLPIITARAEEALRRRISIKGIDYGFKGILLVKPVIYSDVKGCGEVLASADLAIIRFSVLKILLKQEFEIRFIGLENPYLNICFSDDTSNIERLLRDLMSDTESSMRARVDSIALSGARISLKDSPSYLRPLEGSYTIDATLEFREQKKINITDCTIMLPEKRGVLHPDLALEIKEDDFVLGGEVALDKCSLLWVYRWGANLSLPYHEVSGRVRELRITKRSVEGFLKGSSILSHGKPLSVDGYCRVSIPEERVFISNAQGAIQTSSFLVEELLFNFNGDIKSFKIRNINAQIADLAPILSFLPAELYGAVQGNLSMAAGSYDGELKLNCGYDPRSKTVRDLIGSIRIKAGTIPRTSLSLLLYGQPLELSIASGDGGLKRITLSARAAEFSVPESGKGGKSPAGSSFNIPFELSGEVEVGTLRLDNAVLTQVSAGYTLTGKRLSLNPVTGQFMGGEIKGKGAVDLGKKRPRIEYALAFNGVRMQNLSRLSERFRDRLFGVAGGRAEGDFVIEENSGIADSLRGRIEFSIDRGKLVNTGIQDGLGIWLEELKYKLKDLEFNKIYGNIGISGKLFQINSFIFSARDIRLKIDGFIDRSLEGDLKIDLEFTRKFIEDVPNPAIFLQLNKYKRDHWYLLPFQAKGKDITDGRNIKKLY